MKSPVSFSSFLVAAASCAGAFVGGSAVASPAPQVLKLHVQFYVDHLAADRSHTYPKDANENFRLSLPLSVSQWVDDSLYGHCNLLADLDGKKAFARIEVAYEKAGNVDYTYDMKIFSGIAGRPNLTGLNFSAFDSFQGFYFQSVDSGRDYPNPSDASEYFYTSVAVYGKWINDEPNRELTCLPDESIPGDWLGEIRRVP